jgi:hypothetical protein
MKPYTEVHDRWSFLDPTAPNPAVGGYPGAVVFAGDGVNSCHCRTPIDTYYGALGPRLGLAYSLSERTVLRTACGINYSRRGTVGGRAGAQRHRHARLLGQLQLRARTASIRHALEQRRPRVSCAAVLRSSLNAGFVTGRGTSGGVTYGDPDIGGRPPRYQNWNAGVQYATARTLTIGANYAGSKGDFLGSSGRGFFQNQIDPRFLVLGNLLTQPATAANIAAARRIVRRQLPYADSPAPSRRCCVRSRYSAVTDVVWRRCRSNYTRCNSSPRNADPMMG